MRAIDPLADWRRYRSFFLLLGGLAFLAFLPAIAATMFSDDNVYLSFRNRLLREGDWTELFSLVSTRMNAWEYLPFRDLSYWLDFKLYGTDDSVGFHATNLIWYFMTGVAAWWVIRELVLICRPGIGSGASAVAFAGAALFLAHPAHVETVAWVASRKDLMAGFWGSLAVAAAAAGVRDRKLGKASVLAALCLLIASFSKSTGVTQVLMVTAVLVCRASPDWRRRGLALLLPWLVVLGAVAVHYSVAKSTGVHVVNPVSFVEVVERASRILNGLLALLIVPYPLGLYHDVYGGSHIHWLVSFSWLLLIFHAVVRTLKAPSLWSFGVLQITASFLLYLQFVPFGTWSLVSERFLFLGVLGLALVMLDLLARLHSMRFTFWLVAAVVVCWSVTSWQRMWDWETIPSIREAELSNSPDFHNTKRDVILYQCGNKKNHALAVSLAASMPRDYQRDLMLSLIEYRTEYEAYRDVPESLDLMCRLAPDVDAKLRIAQRETVYEVDLSFHNIVASVMENVYFDRCFTKGSRTFGSTSGNRSDNRAP